MLPILLSRIVWGQNFRNKRVLMHCDNLGAVRAWTKLGSTNHGVPALMRRMVSVAVQHNMKLKLVRIAGVNNDIADALSRFQVRRFHQLAPSADRSPTAFPDLWLKLEAEHLSKQPSTL